MQSTITSAAAQEFARRHHAVVDELRQQGHAQLVLTSSEAIFYLTGATVEPLERPFFLVVDAATATRTLLVPELERTHVRKGWQTGRDTIASYREFPAPDGHRWLDVLAPTLEPQFVFEPEMPAHIALTLVDLGGAAADILRPVRLVKSHYEIEQVAVSADYARRGVEQLLRGVYPGATVVEGYMGRNTLQRSILKEQSSYDPLATTITVAAWPAPISAEPHSIPAVDLTLDAGPHVVMALLRVNGYASECERTFFTHAPTGEEKELFHAMSSARELAYSMVRPGVAGADIDAAVNAHLSGLGVDRHEQRMHRTGHGFGLSAHEPPWIALGSTDVLAENMLVSIEPAVYLEGVGGYRHSDTVLVTADGYRSLTPAPDDLDSLVFTKSPISRRVKGHIIRRVAGI